MKAQIYIKGGISGNRTISNAIANGKEVLVVIERFLMLLLMEIIMVVDNLVH